jgi:flagellar biosynthesis protein FlhF
MNVKRYIAPNMQEAMIKVKSELGRDAIILHTRKIKQKGISGLFKKPVVEVVAAVEEKEEVSEPLVQQPIKKTVEPINQTVEPIVTKTVEPIVKEPVQAPVTYEKPKVEIKENDNEINELKSEIDEIKQLIKSYMFSDKKVDEDVLPPEFIEESSVEKEIRETLRALEINESIIEKIFGIVRRQVSLNDHNEQMIKSAIKQAIKEYIGHPYTIDHFIGSQRVFVFVGPTGVGKTTTLAKLAAKLSLLENKKVALITADTYRIAAVDQLKTYSEILGIPLSVVYEASELNDVMFKYKDKDIILLDTAGRSHKSEELPRDLTDLMNNLENPEIFLVLSLTTGYKDIISILDAYSFIDNYKIIFTKLDEASSYSNILNIKVESGAQLSYLTTGQSVPDDIEIATPDKIVDYIIGEIR